RSGIDRAGVERPPVDVDELTLRESAAPSLSTPLGAHPCRIRRVAAAHLLGGPQDLTGRQHRVIREQQHPQVPGLAGAHDPIRPPARGAQQSERLSRSAGQPTARVGQQRDGRAHASRVTIRPLRADAGRIERTPNSGASMPQTDTARLLIACDDQPGIVAAVAGVLASHGANIISLDQHSTDEVGGRFFQRTVIHLDGLPAKRPALEASLTEVAERFAMEWSLHDTATRRRVAIFVSKYDHCLMELLWRMQRGELDIDVTMVVSNHPDLAAAVRSFGVPF